jgi:hypothetical protein
LVSTRVTLSPEAKVDFRRFFVDTNPKTHRKVNKVKST